MYRIKFRISIYGLLSFVISILMIVLFNALFNGFRFMQCSPWNLLSAAPENTTEILGTVKNTPYIQTSAGQVLCLDELKWSTCLTPPYGFQSVSAPIWTENVMANNFVGKSTRQVIRANGYLKTNYYSLLSNGEIYQCSTSIQDEINHIFSSSKLFWLLIPIIGFGISLFFFIKSFIREGDPTYWDFWGRGIKIK